MTTRRKATGLALILSIGGMGGSPVTAQAPASVQTEAATATIPRLFRGRVVHAGESGLVIECAPPTPGAAEKAGTPPQSVGRFYLRGAPLSLDPSAEVRFLAIDDGTHRYVDFFNLPVTMRALRFVKMADAPVAPIATGPTTQPIPPQPAPPANSAVITQKNKNPTPRLKGTSLDEPAKRIGR